MPSNCQGVRKTRKVLFQGEYGVQQYNIQSSKYLFIKLSPEHSFWKVWFVKLGYLLGTWKVLGCIVVDSGNKEVPFRYPLDWDVLFSALKPKVPALLSPKGKLSTTISHRVKQGPATYMRHMPHRYVYGCIGIISILSLFRVKVKDHPQIIDSHDLIFIPDVSYRTGDGVLYTCTFWTRSNSTNW